MITLRRDGPYNTAFKLNFLLPIMLKSELIRAAEKLSIYIPKSYTKDRIGEALSVFILSSPKEVLAVFNDEELTLMKELIILGANSCVVRPMQKRFNNLQILGLVVTYEDGAGKQWKMMMPDEVRACFAPFMSGEAKDKAALLQTRELTFRISLDNLPIYRTFRVLDSISLQELYYLITFLFDWYNLKRHAFSFLRNGEALRLSNLTRLSGLQMQSGEKMKFVYDYDGKNWEHTLELLSADNYTKDSSRYIPACLEARYGNPGEEAGGNQAVKANWSKCDKGEAPSLASLNDTIQFFWKNKV